MSWLSSLLKKLGGVVDAALPVAVGLRTKIAVVACPVLGSAVVKAVISAVYPPAVAVIPYAQAALCSAAPLFAVAGLVRDSAPKA
jgi:hypothetical protein